MHEALLAVAGFIGGYLVSAGSPRLWGLRKVRQVVEEALPAGHTHEWHVNGKTRGRVQLRCSSCNATRQRDASEGR